MNEQNKNVKPQEDSLKKIEGTANGKPSFWKRMLAKKWVFPAAYVAAAAIILTLMWVYQDSGSRAVLEKEMGLSATKNGANKTATPTSQPNTVAVNASAETMHWPVSDRNEVQVALPFYDSKASNELRQAAMVKYGDTFTPHTGIVLTKQDGKTFDVTAAMSGKVIRVEQLPIIGNQVVISHPNGLVTVYQSLSEVKVKKDDEVKQGQVIAQAGRNEMHKDLGTIVHFEVRQGEDGAPLNPEQMLAQAKQ